MYAAIHCLFVCSALLALQDHAFFAAGFTTRHFKGRPSADISSDGTSDDTGEDTGAMDDGSDDFDSLGIRSGVTIKLRRQLVNEVIMREGISVTQQSHMYVGNVTVGSPPQAFEVIYDTGSANLIIPGSLCQSKACMSHNQYTQKKSSTAKHTVCHKGDDGEDVDSVTIHFGVGTIMGDCLSDVICLDGACKQASFIASTSEDEAPFGQFSFDGILGLSMPGMAQQPEFSIFSQLQSAFDKQVFSVFLSTDDSEESEVTFGGINEEHIGSELFWVTVESDAAYWQVKADDIFFDTVKQDLCGDSGCKVAVDTGTSTLAGPTELVNTLKENLGVREDCENYNLLPRLGFLVNGRVLSLRPQDYIQKDSTSTLCQLSLLAVDVPPPRGPIFIFGTPFLHRYFTVYDLVNSRVGFAVAKHGDDVPESLVRINPSGVM